MCFLLIVIIRPHLFHLCPIKPTYLVYNPLCSPQGVYHFLLLSECVMRIIPYVVDSLYPTSGIQWFLTK